MQKGSLTTCNDETTADARRGWSVCIGCASLNVNPPQARAKTDARSRIADVRVVEHDADDLRCVDAPFLRLPHLPSNDALPGSRRGVVPRLRPSRPQDYSGGPLRLQHGYRRLVETADASQHHQAALHGLARLRGRGVHRQWLFHANRCQYQRHALLSKCDPGQLRVNWWLGHLHRSAHCHLRADDRGKVPARTHHAD